MSPIIIKTNLQRAMTQTSCKRTERKIAARRKALTVWENEGGKTAAVVVQKYVTKRIATSSHVALADRRA